jgi:hypothetical protein
MPVNLSDVELPQSQQLSDRQQHQTSQARNSETSLWQELITRVASKAGLDPSLAVSVAREESGLDLQAVNHSSGAFGIMQLAPRTAAALGVNPHDIISNIQGGVRYLENQLTSFGDEAKALAAYNWGPHHVVQAVERWGAEWLSHAPSETQRYVNSIMALRAANGPASSSSPTLVPVYGHSTSAAVSSAPTSRCAPSPVEEVARLRWALSAYMLSASLTEIEG